MAHQGWSQPGMKHLEIGGKQWNVKELLLGGALAAVVLAALAMAIMHMAKPPNPVTINYHFQCQTCKHEFNMTDRELPASAYQDSPTAPLRVDCPNCKASKSAARMLMCPKCLKYFYVPEGEPQICPICKGDIAKLAAEKAAGRL